MPRNTDPVSTAEFQAAIGEIRRRGDERHDENVERLKALEQGLREHTRDDLFAYQRIDKALADNTALTQQTINAVTTLTTKIEGWVQLSNAATFGRKTLIWAASLAAAAAGLWAAIAYFMGKGPPPPGLH